MYLVGGLPGSGKPTLRASVRANDQEFRAALRSLGFEDMGPGRMSVPKGINSKTGGRMARRVSRAAFLTPRSWYERSCSCCFPGARFGLRGPEELALAIAQARELL